MALRKSKRIARSGFKWLIGAVLGGVVAFIGAYVSGVLDRVIPDPGRLICMAREQLRAPAPGTHFTILLSDLQGDGDGTQTRHVAAAFLDQSGLEVVRICGSLAMDRYGSQSAALEQAEQRGRDWLDRYNADLLIWGEVVKADDALRLWFVSRAERSKVGATPYRLENTLLPQSFGEQFANQLVSVATASIIPATKEQGTRLVAALEPPVGKLRRLLADPPPNLSAGQKLPLLIALGYGTSALAELSERRHEMLTQAAAAYEEALKIWPWQDAAELRREVQMLYGQVLRDLGEIEVGSASL